MPPHPRQGHRWTDHRLVIDGVFHRTRTGTPWRDLPARFGPWQTVYNRHRRWSADGRARPLARVTSAGHRNDALGFEPVMPRLRIARTGPGRPRTRPDRLLADKAYSSRGIRSYLRRRGIQAVIPEPSDQIRNRQRRGSRGGRPVTFDSDAYRLRNTVERAVGKLRGYRAVATRYDKRDYVYRGTVDIAAIGIWLRDPTT